MAGRKNGLGRGLDAFFPDRTSVARLTLFIGK